MSVSLHRFFLIAAFIFIIPGIVFSNDWEFQRKPTPVVTQAGEYVFGNTLVLKVNERTCAGEVPQLEMMITSSLTKELKDAEEKTIKAKFFTSLDGQVVEHTETMRIKSVFGLGGAMGITDPSVEDIMGIAILTVDAGFKFWPFDKLLKIEGFPKVFMGLSFSDTEIFDLQHETWSMSGIEKALEEASQYCLQTYGVSFGDLENKI